MTTFSLYYCKYCMDKNALIYVAGHNGMVGSAIVRKLINLGYSNLILKSSNELDLMNSIQVDQFFKEYKPQYVFMAAAKVGGIVANRDNKVEFLYNNLMIQNNVIYSAAKYNVGKLLFLGSSCIYPKECQIPIKEEYLLTGSLESTNDSYALAKIAGLELCKAYKTQYNKDFISCMPTNLYGQNDTYNELNAHVIPSLILKAHTAKINNDKSINIWGSGNPLREFLYVDDLADACVFLMENYNDTAHINVGYGEDITIKDLAALICEVVNYEGELKFDMAYPDGTYRKLMDSSKIFDLGWKPKISLKEGLVKTYELFLRSINQ